MNRGIRLVRCRDAPSYAVMAGHASVVGLAGQFVPILSVNASEELLGLPRDISVSEMVALDVDRAKSPDASRAHDRLCLALDEPVVAAAADFLATQTGRRLEVVDPHTLEAALRRAVTDRSLQSLAIILPSWDAAGRPSAQLYRRVLRLLRSSKQAIDRLGFGLITAATPAALTRLVAKAILQREIATAYRETTAAIMTESDSIERATLPSFRYDQRRGALLLIDRRHLADQTARQAKDIPWSFLLFKGHGRSYCAVYGHLCGARPLDTPAAAPVATCIQGMNCAGDHFARIDPRLYDAPVVAIDCCGAGNWSAQSWEQGIPSVAFHALSGSASAVITSDGVTMGEQDDYLDVLCALSSASTLGDATAWLNAMRHNAGTEFPYVLLGDPEIAAGPERWPDWVTDYKSRALRCESAEDAGIERHIVEPAEGPKSTPFGRARLPEAKRAGPAIWFIRPAAGRAAPRPVRSFKRPDGAIDIWFGAAGATDGMIIERAAAPELPAGLVAAALSIEIQLRRYSAALDAIKPEIREAAAAIVQVEKRLEQGRRGFLTGSAKDLAASVNTAIAAWQAAHLSGLDYALSTFANGGLWPFQMWSFYGVKNQPGGEPCPYCRLPDTLERNYQSFPAGARWQHECMRCDLIADQPLEADGPRLFLEARDELFHGTAATVRVHIDNASAARYRFGAIAVAIDGLGHATETNPRRQAVEIVPQTKTTFTAEIAITKPHFIAHRFRLRALLYLDAEWYLLSRPIVLRHREAGRQIADGAA